METKSEDQLGFHSIATYINLIASKENLLDFNFIVKPDAKAGGYCGVLNRVKLNGKQSDGTDVSLSLVYKDQPNDEFRRQEFLTEKFFTNEASFYNVVLSAFEKMQDEKGIQDADRFVSYPKCYFAGEVVILEDMSPLGFKLANRQKPLDMAHCLLVMKEMGKLHAFSFALRDQKPEEFVNLKASVNEIFIGGMKDYWDSAITRAYAKFTQMTPKANKYSTALKRFCDNCLQMMLTAVDGDAIEPFSVISHGDCWTNNYLFKYPRESNAPEALCLLDFQLARYGSPVCDLLYFISCCTSKETRAHHYDDLLREYHNSLSDFLRKLGSNPERLFPYSALKDQLQHFGFFGVGMAILALPVVADDPDTVLSLENMDAGTMAAFGASENPAVWRRFADFVEDAVDMGNLDIIWDMIPTNPATKVLPSGGGSKTLLTTLVDFGYMKWMLLKILPFKDFTNFISVYAQFKIMVCTYFSPILHWKRYK